MRGNGEDRAYYSVGIAGDEIECLVDTCGMCCYADFGNRERGEEFDGE